MYRKLVFSERRFKFSKVSHLVVVLFFNINRTELSSEKQFRLYHCFFFLGGGWLRPSLSECVSHMFDVFVFLYFRP